MKQIGKISSIIIFVILATTSCASMGEKQKSGTMWGTGLGAGLGAILGQVIGHSTQSTLIGAGIGAVAGGLLGNQVGAYMDKQQAELEEVARQSDALSIRRAEDVLHATFRGSMMFKGNSATLMPGSLSEIQRLAEILAKYPNTNVLVAGHTDTRGSEAYNQKLSESRANSVKNVLIQGGVDPIRIQTVGYGESMPISDNDSMNRRVELKLTPITQS